MKIRLRVLGSGTIMPSSTRNPVSLLVEAGKTRLLLDLGPGCLERLEAIGAGYAEIRTILLTHLHPDHTLALPRLLSAMKNDPGVEGGAVLRLFGPGGTRRFVESWENVYPGITGGVSVEITELEDGDRFTEGDIDIIAASAVHGKDPALSYRISSRSASLVYTGDCEYSTALADLSSGADLIVSECSFPDGSGAAGHMTPSSAGRLAAESGAARVILVHLYPFFGLWDPAVEVRKICRAEVITAEDGLSAEV